MPLSYLLQRLSTRNPYITWFTLGVGAYTVLAFFWLLSDVGAEPGQTMIASLITVPVYLALFGYAARHLWHKDLHPRTQLTLLLLGVTGLLGAVGDGLYFYKEIVQDTSPFPSTADLLYFAMYGCLGGAALLLPTRPMTQGERMRLALDGAMMAIGGWLLTWYLTLEIPGSQESPLLTALSVAYPLMDMLIAFLAMSVALRTELPGANAAMILMMQSLFLHLLADLTFGYQSIHAEFHSGSWPDGLWLIGQFLMLLAAVALVRLPPHLRRQGWKPVTRYVPLLPYTVVVVGFGLLVLVRRYGDDKVLVVMLLGLMMVGLLLGIRHVLEMLENHRLINQRALLSAELGRSEARFRSLVQSASDLILLLDARGRIIYESPSAGRLLGYPTFALLGQPLSFVLGGDEQAGLDALQNALGREAGAREEWTVQAADGRLVPTEVVVSDLLADPNVGGIVLNLRDISERKHLEERLRYQAFHDPLTGLANRRLLLDRLEQALENARIRGGLVGVLYLDLDGFKPVNDTLGHEAGDHLLIQVGDRLRGALKGVATLARLGGDEFAAVVEGPGIESVHQAAELVGTALAKPMLAGNVSVQTGASIGMVLGTGDERPADLLRKADLALYEAKRRGRGRAVLFDPSMLPASSNMH